MSRFLLAIFLVFLLGANLAAQSPGPTSAGQTGPKSPPQPTPSPSATATAEQLVDSLGPADLQAFITLLKSNFTDPDAITDTELNRATVQGLLARLPRGITLLAEKEGVPAAASGEFYSETLIIGQPTAGRAAEYSDLPLPGGKILRVAVAEMISPDGRSLFPEGVTPDLPVEMSLTEKRQIFQSSSEKGMESFIYDAGRPHMNEAALLAGTNPELEAAEAAQQRRGHAPEKPPPHDPVLQRALDVVTSLEVYQKR